MTSDVFRCVTLSDFNLSNFNSYLAQRDTEPRIEPIATPYGQIHQLLRDSAAPCWRDDPDGVFVWTRPEAVVRGFARALQQEPVSHDDVLAEVDQYAESVAQLSQRAGSVIHASWTSPDYDRGLGVLDLKDGLGIANLLMRMNLRLCTRLGATTGFFMLNAQKWLERPAGAFSPKSWYLAKLPFSNPVFKEAALDVHAAVSAIRGLARKLIIVDLDDTLWGGVVGDVGWEHITLGGHDPTGEAFRDFQGALKSLARRGILLGIVSKNEEKVALEAIEKHPEMILRTEDFAGWRINWKDKAHNVAELVETLNLGLRSVVFIDDNPAERSRIAKALPDVLVPEWPAEKTLYRKALLELRCFDQSSVSCEDRERGKFYSVERKRRQDMQEAESLSDWLASLETKVYVQRLKEVDLPRAAQLMNKTNQFNLSTRRMGDKELQAWASASGHYLWTFRVADKFGDLGLTGLVSLEKNGDHGYIRDFVLSCRVMGRMVEETMVAAVLRYARSLKVDQLYATYLPTPRNKPCLEFLSRSIFRVDPQNPQVFRCSASTEVPQPDYIELRDEG